jgi:pSer/pThr/pTyr-binding forkhead associated (FHA) protein
MSIKLIVRWKDEDKQPQEMERDYEKDVVSIGRNIRNDFCISDRFASSYHAKIELDGKNYMLHDLGSTNGTCLNGEQLQPNESKTLSNGDIIKVAKVEIELVIQKKTKKSTVSATPSMHKAAYNSLYEVSKYFISDDFSFKSEKDIETFSDRLQDVIEILCAELFSNVEIYSKLQYELDVAMI